MGRWFFFAKTGTLVFLTALIGFFPPTRALAKECVDYEKAMVQRKRYKWYAGTDKNGKVPLELCEPAPTARVFKALVSLDELGPLTIDRDGYDRGLLGYDVSRFFPDRVNEIKFESKPDSRCFLDHLSPVAYASFNQPNRIHICPSISKYSTLTVMAILLHEARHAEGGEAGPGHVKCLRGGYKGEPACDSSYEAGGAYAVETEFYLRVARTRHLPKAMRQEARSNVLSNLFHHFNKLPDVLKPVYMIQDRNGSVFLADTEGSTNWLFDTTHPSWVAAKVKYFPTAVNLIDGTVLRYSYIQQKAIHGNGIPYLQSYFGHPRQKVKDLLFVANHMNCVLVGNAVECNRESGRPFRRSLDWTRPLHLGALNDALSFTTEDGEVFYYPAPIVTAKQERPEDSASPTSGFRQLETSYRYLSLFELAPGTYIGLNMHGQLVKVEDAPLRAPVVMEPFKKYRFKKAIGPITWSKKLEEL